MGVLAIRFEHRFYLTVFFTLLLALGGCGGSLEGTNTNSGVGIQGKVLTQSGEPAPGIEMAATITNPITLD